jgi:hypothetical protein
MMPAAIVVVDWSQFKAYLLLRMIERTAAQTIRYAKAYHTILLPPTDDKLQMVLQFAPDKRVHIMKAMVSLARFLGIYNTVWIPLRQRFDLKWSTAGSQNLSTFERFFDDSRTLEKMIEWVRKALRVLPDNMGNAVVFNCLTGLRPNESLSAIRLIKDPETFKTYYKEDKQCLEHFKFPEIFLRCTKCAYISVVDRDQRSGICILGPKTSAKL